LKTGIVPTIFYAPTPRFVPRLDLSMSHSTDLFVIRFSCDQMLSWILMQVLKVPPNPLAHVA
jgi:hypothetical protein